LKKYQSNHFL